MLTNDLKALRAEVDRLNDLMLKAQRKAQAALRHYREALVEQYGVPHGVPQGAGCE